ncbi:hypothetical protein NSA19_11480 [Actinomyces bowdenii]|uniref:hypothetical protein n=1 Tax=Actinomyces bowdenii TaxID=131109 RepID=UPI00214C80B4|nr:hypothetical protein [Actinomyces bowdenii]MCR2053449.1 hypothetical protein [Actinomyces bowdenii]
MPATLIALAGPAGAQTAQVVPAAPLPAAALPALPSPVALAYIAAAILFILAAAGLSRHDGVSGVSRTGEDFRLPLIR